MKKIYNRKRLAGLPVFLSCITIISSVSLFLTACGRVDKISNNEVKYKVPAFINGCDISSLISEENSGVRYYDSENNERDLISILSDNGINTIRLRIFNNPYTEAGDGYGGGNCDLEKAITLGKRATNNNLGVLIDFHFSDFYADPNKQTPPKAWKNFTLEEKKTAIYNYTYSAIKKLLSENINITMVQIGNETINGLCGETDIQNICELLNSGCSALRTISKETGKEILSVVHFTDPQRDGLLTWLAEELYKNNVDYDVFATSYYSYWHGSLNNLKKVLNTVAKKYNKKILIAETAYPYTSSDTDNFGNTVSGNESENTFNYEISEAGQAQCIYDIASTIHEITNGIGFFYWEPAWIAIPGNNYDDRLTTWEKEGSGWASSYSREYDNDGIYFGGSSWDNQAFFDKAGKPLSSLNIFSQITHDFCNES